MSGRGEGAWADHEGFPGRVGGFFNSSAAIYRPCIPQYSSHNHSLAAYCNRQKEEALMAIGYDDEEEARNKGTDKCIPYFGKTNNGGT